MTAATSAGVIAIIAAVAAGIGAVVGQVTLLLRSRSESKRLERHEAAADEANRG